MVGETTESEGACVANPITAVTKLGNDQAEWLQVPFPPTTCMIQMAMVRTASDVEINTTSPVVSEIANGATFLEMIASFTTQHQATIRDLPQVGKVAPLLRGVRACV